MGIFRTLIIIAAIYYGFRLLRIYVLPLVFKGVVKKAQQRMADQMKGQGDWNGQKQDTSYSQNIPGPDEVEDVDYEEVKDES